MVIVPGALVVAIVYLFFWEQDLERRLGPGSSFMVCSCSHLAGRDELQRSQGNLEVGSVGLEIVESLSNVLLKLGGVLPRRAVGGDLVQGLGGHFGGDAQRTVLDEDRGT